MKRAVFHPEASQDYLEAIEYHSDISVDLGERFDSEIQRLVGEVSLLTPSATTRRVDSQ